MKKSEIIIACVGLVLVFAVLFGVGAFLTNYDEMIDDFTNPTDATNKPSDDTNKPSDDTNKPSDGTNKPSGGTNNDTSDSVVTPTYSDVYTDGDLGYVTQNGITTFFLILSAPEYVNSASCFRHWCFGYNPGYLYHTVITDNNSKELCHKYSINGNFVWKDLSKDGAYRHYLDVSSFDGLYSSLPTQTDKVYLALWQAENVENPVAEIEFVRENIFRKEDRITKTCSWCGGVYVGYSGFIIDIDHRPIPDENGALG